MVGDPTKMMRKSKIPMPKLMKKLATHLHPLVPAHQQSCLKMILRSQILSRHRKLRKKKIQETTVKLWNIDLLQLWQDNPPGHCQAQVPKVPKLRPNGLELTLKSHGPPTP